MNQQESKAFGACYWVGEVTLRYSPLPVTVAEGLEPVPSLPVLLAQWADWQRNTGIDIRQDTCQAEVPRDETRNDPDVATGCMKEI